MFSNSIQQSPTSKTVLIPHHMFNLKLHSPGNTMSLEQDVGNQVALCAHEMASNLVV